MRSGFTLVEVLVVVAIIAALASLSIASIRHVSAISRNTKCSSNLRQLYIGITLFATENNGALPYSVQAVVPSGTVAPDYWHRLIYPYISNGARAEDWPGPYNKKSVYLCPDDSAPYYDRLSYGINAYLNGRRLPMLSSSLFLLVDATAYTADGLPSPAGNRIMNKVRYEHLNGSANAICVDGSMETSRQFSLPDSQPERWKP